MASPQCIAAISTAAGRDFTRSEVEEIEKAIITRRAKNLLFLSDAKGFAAAAKTLADDAALAALIEKRSRAFNVQTKLSRFAKFDAAVGKELAAVRDMMKLVDAKQKALRDGWLGGLVHDLEQAGKLDVFGRRVGDLDRDIAKELWRIGDTSAPATTNPDAQVIAKILHQYQEIARIAQNDAGAWIGKETGYITRQSHDPFKLHKAGFEAWRDAILPKLSDRTFGDVADRDAFLKKTFRNIVSGDHDRANGHDWLGGFKVPGNLAKRASQERVLHFKSGADWYAYNQQFGTGSLVESIAKSLDHAARNTELMRAYGTNPRSAFDADIKQLVSRIADRDPGDKQIKKLQNWFTNAVFEQLDGAANLVDSPRLAHWAGAIRAVESMAKLGGVVLSSLPDIATNAATLRYNGVGLLQGYATALRSTLGFYGKDAKAIADLMGVGMHGAWGNVLNRFHSGDTLSGNMSKGMNLYFKLNLLNTWTENKKIGVGLMLSRNLARQAGTAFEKLPAFLKETLSRYDIDAAKWDVVRQATVRRAASDTHLTPDAIRFLPDDTIKVYLGKPEASEAQVKRAKANLESSLRAYYVDQVSTSMTEGGAAEKAMLTLGSKAQRGTAFGEALKMMTQFKMFPLTYVTRQLGEGVARRDVPGVISLLVGTTLFGYASTSLKDLAKGLTQRDPTAPTTWIQAFVQGGGAGIYGDFLFADWNRFGGGLLETAAGPGVGSFSEFVRAWGAVTDKTKTWKQKGKEIKGDLLHFGTGHIPGVNIFYAKAALDYLFLYRLQEAINPGYLARHEKKMREETGQRFILRPQT